MTKTSMVAVHGSYFAENYGDTLLVRMMCDKIARMIGKDNVYLAVEGDAREQKDIGYPVVPKSSRREITHLVFGGGGYFGERTKMPIDNVIWSVRNYVRHLSWVRNFPNARKAVIGAGFGPITNRILRSRVRSFMYGCELVLVRDIESLAFMEAYSIRHPKVDTCVDLALTLPCVDEARTGIALHVDNLSQGEIDLVFRSLRASSMQSEGIEVIFDNKPSDTGRNRDKYIKAAAQHGFPSCVFIPYKDVDTLLGRVANYALVITSKLHVGITTIAQGGRAISIPGHQKTIRLYNQLGLSHYCISRPELTVELLCRAIENLSLYTPDRNVIVAGSKRIDGALDDFLFSSKP